MKHHLLIVVTFFVATLTGVSQAPPDTSKVFDLDTYLSWVRAYHPVARQANLLQAQAEAEQLYARGEFDPKFYGNYDRKSFDGKDYYTIGETGLSIPTWYGIDFKVSYNWTDGIFLNPEEELPAAGQAIAGVEIPLAQGLLFDMRRAQVKQANLLQTINEATRRQILNDLLLDAIESYWNWSYAYYQMQVIENALLFAQQRFEITRESYFQGFKPAIDTIESLIQVQIRQIELNDAHIAYRNSTLQLSNFLWYEQLIPLEVTPQLRPGSLTFTPIPDIQQQLELLQANLDILHPDLIVLSLKQEQLAIKERLKLEYLKPKVTLKYNFLADGIDFFEEANNGRSEFGALWLENYKFGINASFPLWMRAARGDLQLVRLEITDNQFKIRQKNLEINNKIEALSQELATTFQQVDTYQAVVANYQRLLDAENEKFRIGESSIFLLNTREQKLIEAQLKLLKLKATYRKLEGKLQWAGGRLS